MPYDYQTQIGLKQEPLYAPLTDIMHHYFDSRAPERSLKLARRWGGETTVQTYPGEDHGLLTHQNSSWDDILAFLRPVGK